MLYVVSTPIGNLSDITLRAIETLKKCDYILCEDTRHSATLLNHYEIKKPLKSFHKFNELTKQDQIIADLNKGLNIALISDAGTPGISDPGEKLIHACIEQNLTVTPIPGACAAISALCCSGLDTSLFQFIGFLPKKAGELKKTLQSVLQYDGTTICYESPNRLLEVLETLHSLDPSRKIVLAREITKIHEEFVRGSPQTLINHWNNSPQKGEVVLLISKNPNNTTPDWEHLTPEEHVQQIQSTYGASKQEAIVICAKIRGVSKRDIYNIINRD